MRDEMVGTVGRIGRGQKVGGEREEGVQGARWRQMRAGTDARKSDMDPSGDDLRAGRYSGLSSGSRWTGEKSASSGWFTPAGMSVFARRTSSERMSRTEARQSPAFRCTTDQFSAASPHSPPCQSGK